MWNRSYGQTRQDQAGLGGGQFVFRTRREKAVFVCGSLYLFCLLSI